MNQKPSDLLLSVLDFFGILIPGAVFVFLHGDFLLSPLDLSIGKLQTPVDGVLAFFVAFVLGSFLHGFSDILDRFTQPLHSEETKRYLEAVRDCLTLPPEIPKNFTNVFYSVFSFIRINNSYALAELERQEAIRC